MTVPDEDIGRSPWFWSFLCQLPWLRTVWSGVRKRSANNGAVFQSAPRPDDASPGPPRAVSCARRALQSPSAGPREPPRRLTRRLFTTFPSATLRSAPRPHAPLPRRRSKHKRRHCPQAWGAMPPSDSAALHCVKTAETGDSPGPRITEPSSGNAHKFAGLRCGPVMRWPPMLACSAGQKPVPASLSPLGPGQVIAQQDKTRAPRDPHDAR